MRKLFLHGFGTNPQIWQNLKTDLALELDFKSLDLEAKRISTFVDNKTILIGWSMGGMIAMQLAANFPVGGLVLISTTPKFIKSEDYLYGLTLTLLIKLRREVKANGISAFHTLVFKDKRLKGLAFPTSEQAEKELDELEKIDLRPVLPEIKVPTLIIHGSKDEVCLPAAAKYLRENIPGSQLVILEGIGHAPMIEAPGILNLHLQKFFSKHDR